VLVGLKLLLICCFTVKANNYIPLKIAGVKALKIAPGYGYIGYAYILLFFGCIWLKVNFLLMVYVALSFEKQKEIEKENKKIIK